MKKTFLFPCAAIFAFSLNIFAQPRPMEKVEKSSDARTTAQTTTPAPVSFQAKYEGGLFGFSDKQEGSLKFDDANKRLVFFGKDGREKFSIPYKSMLVVAPQTKSVRSGAGTAVSQIPYPGAGLAGLIREKRRYLLVNYNDPDSDVRGSVNFKLGSRELLESVIQTLGAKAKLTQRGDAYYRPRDAAKTDGL